MMSGTITCEHTFFYSSMTDLIRTLTLRDLTLLIVGAVIGSGIFIVPSAVMKNVDGFVGLALLVWLAGGLLSLLGALTYGELSARKPHAGGLYVFIRDAFGPLPAFLYGWSLFFVIGGGAIATLASAFSAYVNQIVTLSPIASKTVPIAMIMVVTILNVRSVRRSSDVQNWTTGVKVSAILIMGVLLLIGGTGAEERNWKILPSRWDAGIFSQLGVAMIGVLWAYEGWQYATFSAAEIHNPKRAYPRAFLAGLILLIFVYMFANVAYVFALGPKGVIDTNRVAASAVSAVFSAGAGKAVAALILISILSACNSIALTAPRVYYAMSRDGLFFDKLARVHQRFRTPVFAIVTGSLWACVLTLSGTFEQLFTYVVFGGWIFYGLAAGSIFFYRKHNPQPEAYTVPGYPLAPIAFILAAAALVLNTVVKQPRESVAGILIMLTGVPAYLFWRARRSERTS